jgi:mono/diheme cytochrome c family protein
MMLGRARRGNGDCMDRSLRSTKEVRGVILGLALSFAALAASILAPGRLDARPQKSAQPDEQFQTLIRSTEGADLFRAYCASCHGRDAKGHGPAAPALKATVPDLTMITRNNGGDFPVDRIRRIITGDHVIASHGSREMPIWGPIFHQIEADIDRGNVRLDNLIKYLESIQAGKHA